MSARRGPICFVTAVPATLDAFVSPIAEAARREGYRTIAITGGQHGARSRSEDAFDAVYYLPEFRRRGLGASVRALIGMVRVIKRNNVELLHLHTPFAVALGRLAASISRTPSIAVVHGTLLDGPGKHAAMFRIVERAFAWLSRNYVTLNCEDAAWYQRMAPRARVVIAPCGGAGVNVDGLSDRRGGASESRDVPVALVLGRLTHDKNPDLAVEGWLRARSRVPGLRLRFVGSALSGERAWEPPSMAGVEHRGWTDTPADELARATVLLTCSPREGFPMAVAEALVAGVPVVAVSNRGTRMIAGQVGPPLLRLVPADPQQIAEALAEAAHYSGAAKVSSEVLHRWSQSAVIDFHVQEIERVAGPSVMSRSGWDES